MINFGNQLMISTTNTEDTVYTDADDVVRQSKDISSGGEHGFEDTFTDAHRLACNSSI